MNKITTSVLLFFVLSQSYSQSIDFVGFIKLENNTFINYRLDLEISEAKVSGYSYTDLNGEHETKSTVVGKYTSDTKTIEFREVDIVYTRSPIDQFDFCYVFFRGKLNRSRLSGEFKAYYEDLETCVNGEIFMSEAEKVERRKKSVTRKIERRLARKNMTDTITEKLENMKFAERRGLKSNENLNIFWKKSYLKLSIWDAGTVDNDTIVLSFNQDDPRQLIPAKRHTELEFYLKGEKNSITIKALSEGSEPPNTTKIKLSDGDGKTIDLVSDLKVGEETKLTFYREIPKKK